MAHRLIVLALVVSLTALAAYLVATRLRVDTSLDAFVASNDPSRRALAEYRKEFGQEDFFLVVVEGDVFTSAYVERLTALHRELSELDVATQRGAAVRSPDSKGAAADDSLSDEFGDFDDVGKGSATDDWLAESGGSVFEEVTSLVNARRTRGDGRAIVVDKWFDPLPDPGELGELRAAILKDRGVVGRLVGRNGRHSVILLRSGPLEGEDLTRVYDAIGTVVARHSAEGFRPYIGGHLALNAALSELMSSEFGKLLAIALLVMLVMLGVIFRHVLGVFGPISVVLVAVVWTYGAMACLGFPMTMLATVLPVFLVTVGIGDSVHVQSAYRDARADGLGNDESICSAIGSTGVPCLLTTLTTMAGLLSFNLSSVSSIGHVGTIGALGTLFAFVNSVLLLPLILSVNRRGVFGVAASSRGATWIDAFLVRCNDLSRPGGGRRGERRRRATLAVMAMLGIGAVVVVGTRSRVWHDPVEWLPADHGTVRAFHALDDEVGGTGGVNLLIKSQRELGVADLEVLRGLEQVEREVRAYQHPIGGAIVGNSVSVLDIVRETNRALHGGDEAFYMLPDDQRALSDIFFLFETAGRDELRRLATLDLRTAHLSFQVRWLEATAYHGLVAHVADAIERHVDGAAAVVEPTGTMYTVVSVVSNLIADLIQSFAVAFALIACMLVVLFRSLKLGVVAMIPNTLPVVITLGLMSLAGIPIDLNNLLIGSIVLGLAVDDTIHFFHRFKVSYDQDGRVEGAIDHAMRFSGRAMVGTSVILSLGFLVYVSSVMSTLALFGILTAIAIVIALAMDLIGGPALLRTVYGDVERATGGDPV